MISISFLISLFSISILVGSSIIKKKEKQKSERKLKKKKRYGQIFKKVVLQNYRRTSGSSCYKAAKIPQKFL